MILPLLEAFLKLFICSTPMHLLHILLNLCLFKFLFIYIYIKQDVMSSKVLTVQKVGASSILVLAIHHWTGVAVWAGTLLWQINHFWFIITLELFQQFFFPIGVIACLYTVKPLSIIPVRVVLPQLLFISSSPENCQYEQHVIILEALFLRVSFSHVICSRFPLLMHSMPRE